MLTAGVAIDDWKLPIFKKHLEAAGYSYAECPGIVAGTLLLKVNTSSVDKLKPIIENANAECAKWRKNKLN